MMTSTQKQLNLSLLQSVMDFGVREKVITSCPHKPCHKDITEKYRRELLKNQGTLSINQLRDNEVVEGVEKWYMKECYVEEEDEGAMDINEEDFRTNEIYLSKVFMWHIKNGESFDDFCEELEAIGRRLWEEDYDKDGFPISTGPGLL